MNLMILLLAAGAAATVDPLELLQKSLEPSAASYDGRMTIETFSESTSSFKEMRIRFLNPSRYRRELFDVSGRPAQIFVSDGVSEWIYDKARNKVWQGEAADSDFKQFGLISNYEIRLSTSPSVARRPAWLLELYSRRDGKIQRRIWVDKKYGLVLQNQIFSPEGRLASAFRFRSLKFPKNQDLSLFNFHPPDGAAVVKRLKPDALALDQAKTAAGLEPRMPAWLPSGYVFEGLNVLSQGRLRRKIIHYRFSDGINVLSLFQCPPRARLDFGHSTGRRISLASGPASLAWTHEGHVLAWSSQGSKFILISPLEAQTLRRVAESVK